MPNPTADLHLHTTFSDGIDAPEQVVVLARQAGLSTIAITDHDNTEALAIAAPAAQRLGLELIPGIEMSASTAGCEVHVLGFLFDAAHPALKEHLKVQQARRIRRVHQMVEQLAAVGVTISAEEVLLQAKDGTVGRPHVARILIKHGYAATNAEAFEKYLGNNGPGFVPGSPLPPKEVIGVIRAAGGVPVLAHPIYLGNDALIDEFVRDGLAGLEVHHSSHTPEHIRHYAQIAARLKLLVTGGSDYHGATVKEGLPIGAVKVPCQLIEAMREWQLAHKV